MTTQKRENKQNRHRIHTNETYRARAVGSSSIEGETGNIVGAVIVARTRGESKVARKSWCPEPASGLLGKLTGDPRARRQRLV
jgi:hypothetical protein